MSILLTDCAPRKGYVEFQPQQSSSSFELDVPWDGGDDYLPEEDIPAACSDLDGDVPPLSADEGVPDLDPRGAVEAWRIAALGRRPRDYLTRDLLLNSLWRDERPRVFHELAKKPPVWVEDHVRHLPGTQQKQAVQLTALHYLHRQQLATLWAGDVAGEFIGAASKNLLTRLWDCWPYGAKFMPPVRAETAPHGCWCRLAWLCPWCYARRAVGLERLLREGSLRKPHGKHLVLARLATFGEQASPDVVWRERWCGRYDAYYLQSPKKVRAMRAAIAVKLRRFAHELGITGGILTHQISPWRTKDYRRGVEPGLASFRHDYALLGEVTFADEDHAERFRDQTGYRTQPFGALKIRHPDLADCYQSPGVFWSFHPADDPQVDALRLFLAGSSANYPVGNLEWHAGGLTARPLARNGVHGALAVPPHFMMAEIQWWSYAEATHGLPLYVPFGTWRTAIGKAKRERADHRHAAGLLPLPERTLANRRRQALQNANAQRNHQASEDLGSLLEVARHLFKQAVAEQSGRRGRPAHRARLKTLLEEQGHAVPERRLKQLMRELGS
jgi:hypothetical protein